MAIGDTLTNITATLTGLAADEGGQNRVADPVVVDVIAVDFGAVEETTAAQPLGIARKNVPVEIAPIVETFSVASIEDEIYRWRAAGQTSRTNPNLTLTFDAIMEGAGGHKPFRAVCTGRLTMTDISGWTSGGITQLDCTFQTYKRTMHIGSFDNMGAAQNLDADTHRLEEIDIELMRWYYHDVDLWATKRAALGLPAL